MIDGSLPIYGWGIYIRDGPNRVYVFGTILTVVLTSVLLSVLWSVLNGGDVPTAQRSENAFRQMRLLLHWSPLQEKGAPARYLAVIDTSIAAGKMTAFSQSGQPGGGPEVEE